MVKNRNPFGDNYQRWLEAPFQEREAEKYEWEYHHQRILDELENFMSEDMAIDLSYKESELMEEQVDLIYKDISDGKEPNYELAANAFFYDVKDKNEDDNNES